MYGVPQERQLFCENQRNNWYPFYYFNYFLIIYARASARENESNCFSYIDPDGLFGPLAPIPVTCDPEAEEETDVATIGTPL